MPISQLNELARRYELTELGAELERIETDDTVEVGFLGEFSSGKSTLINTLVGHDDLLPVKVDPCTARIGRVAAVASIEEPAYYRQADDGSCEPTDRGTFSDVAQGLLPGKTLVQLPPTEGFPGGFVFVDTPGLGSLKKTHADVTFGELPFLDAAVICIDANKGGVNQSVRDFLVSPGVRHLQHRFLVALTHADELTKSDRKKVYEKALVGLSRTLNQPADEIRPRLMCVSGISSQPDPGVAPLRTAISEVFESRFSALSAERSRRAAQSLVPRAVEALKQYRDALGETSPEFDARKADLEARAKELAAERRKQSARLDKLANDLRAEVTAVCNRHRSPLASATTANEITIATENLGEALTQAVGNSVDKLDAGLDPCVSGIEADLKRTLQNINRGAELGKTLVTAAVTAYVVPGAGLAKDGAQAAAGGVARGVAAKGAKAAAKKGAEEVVKQGALKTFFTGFLKIIDDVNPVNYLGDMIAEQIKLVTVDSFMSDIAAQTVSQVSKMIENHFESEVFADIESQLAELSANMDVVAQERRAALAERSARVQQIDEDIRHLENVARQKHSAPEGREK